eukprot:838804-Amphidinium_carterae.4
MEVHLQCQWHLRRLSRLIFFARLALQDHQQRVQPCSFCRQGAGEGETYHFAQATPQKALLVAVCGTRSKWHLATRPPVPSGVESSQQIIGCFKVQQNNAKQPRMRFMIEMLAPECTAAGPPSFGAGAEGSI